MELELGSFSAVEVIINPAPGELRTPPSCVQTQRRNNYRLFVAEWQYSKYLFDNVQNGYIQWWRLYYYTNVFFFVLVENSYMCIKTWIFK